MPQLFSSPADQAKSAATTQADLQNSEVDKELQYVNSSEGQLRGAIAGLGPNPYFQAGAQMKPTPVDPSKTTNFFSAAPQTGTQAGPPAQSQPPPQNLFAQQPGQPRAAMPIARTAAAQ